MEVKSMRFVITPSSLSSLSISLFVSLTILMSCKSFLVDAQFRRGSLPIIHLNDDIVEVYEVSPNNHVRYISGGRHQHHRPQHHPEVNHLISMLLTPSESHESWDITFDHDSSSRHKRWPHGKIPFEIHHTLLRHSTLIHRAMEEIERKSCIRFKERDDEDDYIVIRHGSGCFSSVGRRGGAQTVSLGRGCANFGIILHELMHVIGFYHLHQRHDRDKYLEIHWENINPRFINNFKLLGPEYIPLDEKFDYDSVMMYGETSFSRDGRGVTMTPTYHGVTILDPAYKTRLSDIDVRSINKMYSCGKYDNYVDYD